MEDVETIFYDDDGMHEEQPWHYNKPAQTASPAAATAVSLHQRLYWAALLVIMVACAHFTAIDHGPHPQSLSTSAQLVSGLSSGNQHRLSLHSSVTKVDPSAGLLELELLVQHPAAGSAGSPCSGSGVQLEAVLGSTSHGAAQVVVPLCAAAASGQPITAVLPLVKQSAPHPFDEHTADVRLRLQPSAQAAAAGVSSASGLELDWSAVWAVQGLQVAVERKMSPQARLLAAAAGAGIDGDSGWGSALMEQLAPSLGLSGQPEVVYSVRLARSAWLRIIHLTAALVQVLAVGWCCLLLLGHCVCAYLMQRFLCSRVHGMMA